MSTRFIQGSPVDYQGRTDGTVVPAGYIGEVKSVIQSGAISITTATNYTNVGSVIVPKGVWSIEAHALFLSTGTTVVTDIFSLGYSTDSSTGFSDRDDTVARTNQVYFAMQGNYTSPGQSLTNWRIGGGGSFAPIVLAADTTYYFKTPNRAGSGSIDIVGARLIFKRIA